MARRRNYDSKPATIVMDGDERILGVKLREHPSQIPRGYCAGAVNLRFREGIPEPRLGTVHLAWLNNPSAAGIGKRTTLYGTGRFRDTTGVVWTVKAADGAVYASVANNYPVSVPLPAGVTITSPVYFEQFQNALIMMRGSSLDPLQCTDLLIGFTAVPAAPAGLGLSNLPRGNRAITAGNRLWVMTGTDQVWASDLLDHTAYDEANKFRISDGTPDNLVTLAVFNETNLVCGKERSIWRITDIVGTLASSQVLPVTKQYGCVAANSMVDIGTDLWWWSQDGPASLTITEFNELQTTAGAQRPMPGADIRPLVARVNAMYRHKIAAAVWDRKVYFAVPLDEAESALRHELVSGNYRFFATASLIIPANIGSFYRFVKGPNELQMDNLTESFTGSTDFRALETGPPLQGTALAGPVTGSVKQLFKGVNNAVLVCDLDLLDPESGYGTWQGYDQAASLEVQSFFLTQYGGKDRLCFDGEDGWCCLYEEGYEDAAPEPYVDVTVTSAPAAGNTIQIGGGNVVIAEAQQTNNVSGLLRWGIGVSPSIALAGGNLWVSLAGPDEKGGYSLAANTNDGWTAPNTHTQKIANGVRFTSTNGLLPAVAVTGSWSTLTQVQWQAIETEFISRAYRTPQPVALHRGLVLAMQLQTWTPRYTVYARPEGVAEEETLVTDRTRSRTRYDRPFNKADWTATNVNDDFDTEGRQDYSLNLSATGFKLGDGLGLGLHQEATHRLRPDKRARAMQVRITNNQGRCRLIAIGYEARESDRSLGIKL